MSNKPTLVILAAGMASRYGIGAKQTDHFGPSGETILEYSVYDAIKAGFGKVVFIIREELADSFKNMIEPKLVGKIEIDYVDQTLDKFIGNHQVPADRKKPFGTAHALLCCKGKVQGPFAVINADDYYGAEPFVLAYEFLNKGIGKNKYACVGYELINTLSDNGSVTRGEIFVDTHHHIEHIIERKEIVKGEGGKAFFKNENGKLVELPLDTKVSMNFFCFDDNYIDWLENEYQTFLDNNLSDLKSEFLIPEITDKLIKSNTGTVQLIPTSSIWFGVTYKEDAPVVKEKFKALVEEGKYPASLWQ